MLESILQIIKSIFAFYWDHIKQAYRGQEPLWFALLFFLIILPLSFAISGSILMGIISPILPAYAVLLIMIASLPLAIALFALTIVGLWRCAYNIKWHLIGHLVRVLVIVQIVILFSKFDTLYHLFIETSGSPRPPITANQEPYDKSEAMLSVEIDDPALIQLRKREEKEKNEAEEEKIRIDMLAIIESIILKQYPVDQFDDVQKYINTYKKIIKKQPDKYSTNFRRTLFRLDKILSKAKTANKQ